MLKPDPQSAFVGLVNPKTPTNVGAIMRAAGCYQASAVRYTGERYGYAARYHTDTNNVTGRVPLIHVDDILAGLPDGMKVVCDAADSVVYVPTIGCMNLAATVNVVLYDRLAKSREFIDDEELIKSSRDVNNRLKRNHN